MSCSKKELMKWLTTLDDDDFIHIDEGGLALQSENCEDAWIEIGGDGRTEDENNETQEKCFLHRR